MELGFRISENVSRCFDALQVSIRGSIPASALSSEELAVSISRLYDLFFVAWKEALSAVLYTRSRDSCALPPLCQAPNSEEEDILDAKLTALRARRRNAAVASAEIEVRRAKAAAGVAAITSIAYALKMDQHSGKGAEEKSKLTDTTAKLIVEHLGCVDGDVGSIQDVLKNERDSNKLLERIGSDVRRERVFVDGKLETFSPLRKLTTTSGPSDANSRLEGATAFNVGNLEAFTERLQTSKQP